MILIEDSADRLQVQAAIGRTAAAAAAVAAVVATEAKWAHSSAAQDSQAFTPSELAEEVAAGRLQALQDVFPISQAGAPRSAGDVVQGWKAKLDYAHQQAKLAGELFAVVSGSLAVSETGVVWWVWGRGWR